MALTCNNNNTALELEESKTRECTKHQALVSRIDRLDHAQLLADGAFGSVFVARLFANEERGEELVAIKVGSVMCASMHNETAMLKRLTSPYIANFLFCEETEEHLILGMEFCRGGDLFELMYKYTLLPTDVSFLAAEIALALDYLHSQNVVLCDLKPENIALTESGHIRLIDLGLAVQLDEKEHTKNEATGRLELVSVSGTVHYASREVLMRIPHSFDRDWWSFGVCLFEMCFKQLPWGIHDEQIDLLEMCDRICKMPLTPPDSLSHASEWMTAYDLVDRLLEKSREERWMCLQQIQNHALFRDISWTKGRVGGLQSPFSKVDLRANRVVRMRQE